MITCGIDPGLEHTSYGVVHIAPAGRATAYGRTLNALAHGKIATPGQDLRTWDVAPLLSVLKQHRPAVIAIEGARGAVRGKVDADPILRNNLTAGILLGLLHAAGYSVACVASGGDAAGWNWRGALGVRGSGPAQRDASVRGILRLRGIQPPTGPRGGQDQDAADALGLAAAAADRACARSAHCGPLDALILPDRAATLVLERRTEQRRTRTANRKLQAKYGERA